MSNTAKTALGNVAITKIIVIGAVLTNLIFATLAGISLYHQRIQAESEAQTTTRNICQILEQNISGIIKESDLGLLTLKDEYERQLTEGGINEKRLNSLLQSLNAHSPHVVAFRIADPSGTVIYGKGRFDGKVVQRTALGQEYFNRFRDATQAGLVISKPSIGKVSKKWIIIVARRLNNPDGSFSAVVIASIPLEQFNETFASIRLGKGSVISLRDEQMSLIARHPEVDPSGKAIGQRPVSKELQKLLAEGKTAASYYTPTGSDNIARTVSFRKIGYHPLYIVVGISSQEYLANWWREVIKISALLLFAIILTSGSLRIIYRARQNEYRNFKKLAKQEEIYRIIADNTYNWEFWIAPDDTFLYVSPSCLQITGHSAAEFFDDAGLLFQIIHPEDRAKFQEHRYEANTGTEFDKPTIFRIIHKDGTIHWIDHVCRPIVDSSGIFQGSRGSNRDITDRKQIEAELVFREEALATSERFLKTIVDSEPECIKMLDIDGNLLMMNPAGLEMIEADTFEQVKGACVCSLVTEPYRDAFMALTKQVFQGIPGTLEFETIGLKGRHIWLETHAVPFRNERGTITALLGITRNITERKRNQEQLQTSEENYRSLTGLTSDYVHRCTRKGSEPFRIEWIGGSVGSISGYSVEEIYEFGCWLPLVHPEDKPDVMSYLFSLVPGDFKQKEFRILTKDGLTSWIQEASRCVAGDEEGELVLFGAAKDITERKVAELDRDNLAKQLLHSQKLESLGVLAGGIAHDFNNILTSIIGNADLALMRMTPETPGVENLHKIEQAAIRAADLAKQMLAYSGKGQFVIKNLDMNQLLKEMIHLLEVSISKKVELRFNLSQTLPSVEADTTQIQQIIMNLVINASEAIGDSSGTISITTGSMLCDKKYLEAFWLKDNISTGEYVCLEICDTGCGMDKETQEKIFDPFFTTKFTGRGLGMAAVHGIIRGHKGAINVYSELNKGSSFKILLPASGKPVEIPNLGAQHGDWNGNGKVLLVDDEETVRDVGTAMLHELGFSTITANDGDEALAIFKAIPDIAFVILDLTMPRMDGEQCFHELIGVKPDVKVIISSGFSEQDVSQRFVGKRLSGFIQKPYKLSVLKDVIKNAI